MSKRRLRQKAPPDGSTSAGHSLRRRLDEAIRLHQDGQSAHAELLYRDILREAPGQPRALGMLGLIEAAKGRREEAAELLTRSVAADPASAPTRYNLGLLLQDLGRHGEALVHLEAAAVLRPDMAQVQHACGLSLKALGRLEPALARYRAALRLAPDHAEALNNAGVVLRHLGRGDEAVAMLERAVALRPASAPMHNNLGAALHQLGRHEEAATCFERAVQREPGFAEAQMNLGVALYELKRFDPSEAALRRAEALNPDSADVMVNLGNLLRERGRHDEALALYRRAIELRPGEPDVPMNTGNLMRDIHRFDEALEYYAQARTLDPGNADVDWNEAVCRLSMGDFERGWAMHESRRRIGSLHDIARRFAAPLWLGDAPIEGRTIHLYAEQGLGDTLQFCRYARVLADRGARVILEVQPPLLGLLAQLDGTERVIARGGEDPAADLRCPLLSLPYACRTTLATVPAPRAYVKPDAALALRWAGVIGPGDVPRIGLAWSGNPKHPDDHRRSMPLTGLLAALPERVRLWSLQKELGAADRELIERSGRVGRFEDNDFVHTAAQIASLDVVIAVDTSIAHLAAALGKPVWLMLAYTCDWRWMWGRDDSPWYPSVTLFRQARTADWSEVLTRIGERATALAGPR